MGNAQLEAAAASRPADSTFPRNFYPLEILYFPFHSPKEGFEPHGQDADATCTTQVAFALRGSDPAPLTGMSLRSSAWKNCIKSPSMRVGSQPSSLRMYLGHKHDKRIQDLKDRPDQGIS